jgi:HlyD family secretion protein
MKRTAHPAIMQKPIFIIVMLLVPIMSSMLSCRSVSDAIGLRKPGTDIPVVRVVREPVEIKIHTMGELRPAATSTIVAPAVAGGTLQIVRFAETGAYVNRGDIVVEFDAAEQEYNLEQSRSQLEEAEQQIRKMKAEQAVRVAKERVALLQGRSEVRRAELKVKGNDLLSAIEARKNEIGLEESARRLEQLERDISSRAASDAADLAVQEVARTRAMLGIKLAEQFIESMTCRAPFSGIVTRGQSIEALMSGSGSIFISSETEIPEYRPGAQAVPGRAIASIQEVDRMEIVARVIETDRAGLEPGQEVEVVVDTNPSKTYKGAIKSLDQTAVSSASASTTLDYIEALSTRSFGVIFSVDTQGDPLSLAATARVTITGKEVRDALSIPRQAVHQKGGEFVVYIRNDDGWEAAELRILYLTESRAIVDGLPEGTEVALVNPDQVGKRPAVRKGPLASILGGTGN